MSLEKEIRIAKLQIMWTIAVVGVGLWNIIRTTEFFLDLLLIPIYLGIWFLGCSYLRKGVEEKETEE